MRLKTLVQAIAGRFGYSVVRSQDLQMTYFHDYGGGYDEYRRIQVLHNKRKLGNVWADETTLGAIASDVREQRGDNAALHGICHGARNGFEVAWFAEHLGAEMLGTDIAETATQFDHMLVWDFHDDNPEWLGHFDFVYSNSLDQAMDPRKALAAWARQLKPGGRVYVEHTMAHAAAGAGEMDPFGAHPMVMPYLLFEWGKGSYRLTDIVHIESKQNKQRRAWVFVLEACVSGADQLSQRGAPA